MAAKDNRLSSFWHELTTASWVATVGLPLGVTLIAIALSVMLVRKQLHHDRVLVRSDRRAGAARALGHALVELAREPDQQDADGPFWEKRGWPSMLTEERREAELVLGPQESIEDVLRATRSTLWIWRSCRQIRPQFEAEGLDPIAINDGIAAVINPWLLSMRDFGRELIRWEGIGDMPRLDIGRKTHVPLPPRKTRGHAQWLMSYQREFDRAVRRIHARYHPKEGG